MKHGLYDIGHMLKLWRVVLFFAWSEIRARYKRSVLGPFWITISTAIGVVGLGFIWSELFRIERVIYVPMLTVGLVLWQFISGSIVEASTVFIRQAGIIRNLNMPLSMHPAQLILRQLINLIHALPLFFVVVLVLGGSLSWTCLWALPGLILVALNLFWVVLFIGVMGARFRDLEYLISMIVPLLMFFSPVLYRPNALPFSAKLIWLNPLTYMIEIVRSPLLGEVPSMLVVGGNLAIFFIGGLVSLALFNKKCRRIALWV